MKTAEELNALKEEVEAVSRKLHELTEEELEQVSGGLFSELCCETLVSEPVVLESGVPAVCVIEDERPAL